MNAGVYQVDEIAYILGLERRILEITISDLTTHDLITVSSDVCSLLKKGKDALQEMRRIEKKQDTLSEIYMEGLSGHIISDISNYTIIDSADEDDNKLKVNIRSDDLKNIKDQFVSLDDIFNKQFNSKELSEGMATYTQELLTIDGILKTYVSYIRFPIYAFVSSNSMI